MDSNTTRNWVKAYLEAKLELEGKDSSTLCEDEMERAYSQVQALNIVCIK